MNVLPKLVKAYYTLDETFDRLKRMGAELSKVQDIQLLDQEGKIELSLLCNQDIILINIMYAVPMEIKWSHELEKYNVSDLVDCSYNGAWDSSEIGGLFEGLEREKWVSYNMQLGQTFSDVSYETMKPFAASFHNIEVADEISVISPNNIALDETVGKNVIFFGSDWLLTSKICAVPQKLTVVEINGEHYYVCRHVKGNPLSKGVSFHEKEKKCVTQLFPILTEDSFLISDYVVTKEELENFEQTYLGIKHDVNVAKGIVVIKGRHQQRVECLEVLIKEIGLDKLIPMKRVGVWAELAKRYPGPILFPPRYNSQDSMVRKFFGRQNLISFKRGR